MPPKKVTKTPQTTSRKSVAPSTNGAEAATGSAGNVAMSVSKKRKADEDAHILKYAQQIKQKELEKKQRQSLGGAVATTLGTTPSTVGTFGTKKSKSKSISTTSTNASAATTVTSQRRQTIGTVSTTVKASGRKSQYPLKEQAVEEEDEDMEEEYGEYEEVDVPINVQQPPSKRRRIDNSSIESVYSTKRSNITNVAPHHAASGLTDPLRDAKQWYQEKESSEQRRSSSFTATVRATADILSTPKPPPSHPSATTTVAQEVAFPPVMNSNNETLTPPRRNVGMTTAGSSSTSRYRSSQLTTDIVDMPPSSQTLRKSASTLQFKRKGPQMEKAPFGSPIPTIPSAVQQQNFNVVGTSVQSPLPALPSVHELSIHEPTILSPNYHRRDDYDDSNASQTTMQQHQYEHVHQENDVFDDSNAEAQHLLVIAPSAPAVGNKDTWIAAIAFVCVLMLSFLVALVMDPPAVLPESFITYLSSLAVVPNLTVMKKQPCFLDYPIRNNVEIEEGIAMMGYSANECEDQTIPCPRGGHCMDGKLKLCYDSYLQVSPDGDSCVFTDEAQRDVDAVFDLVTKYTVQHICVGPKRAKNPFFVQESSSSLKGNRDESVVSSDVNSIRRTPLFEYRAVTDVLLLPYRPKILLHATQNDEHIPKRERTNKVVVEQNERDGSILIGLDPSQNIQLPLDCYMTKVTFSIMKTLVVLIGTVSVWIFSRIIWYYIEYPLVLMILTFTISLIAIILQKRSRARRAQVQFTNEVVSLRERVYDELMKDKNVSIPARIICDRIAWNLYPKSSQKRRRIHEVIFPCVSRDLETDSRIVVSWRATTNGIAGRTTTAPELHWQWNDTQPHTATAEMEHARS